MAAATNLASPPGGAERLELVLAELEHLPALPAVALRLIEITGSDNCSVAEVSAVVQTDQAVAARLLSWAQRAHLGAGRVDSIDRAVKVLGLEAVRNLVLSIKVFEAFHPRGAERGGLDRTGFWLHSLAVASAAQSVGEELGDGRVAAEAFLCGLLHDVGKTALDACMPKSYARVVRRTERTRECICDVEREILGVDHTVAGKRLAERWRLPPSAAECIWLHHFPPDVLPASVARAHLVRVVHLADDLVRRQRIGYSGYNHCGDLVAQAAGLGLPAQGLERVTARLVERLQQQCALVGLNDIDSEQIYLKSLAAANEELGRINSALGEKNIRLGGRAACFGALAGLAREVSAEDDPAAVCRQVAECISAVLELPNLAVFAVSPRTTRCPVVIRAAEESGVEWVQVGGDDATARADVLAAAVRHASWIAAPPELVSPVLEKCRRALGAEPVRMFALVHAGRLVGGALFAGEPGGSLLGALGPAELEGVSAACGLALASAWAREESRHLAEELAEVNRRLHLVQEELLRRKSVGMVAEMAAGCAHELNNPLAVIAGRAQMLRAQLPEGEGERGLGIIDEQARKASQIVSELMSFARPAAPQAETLSLSDWAGRVQQRWQRRPGQAAGWMTVQISDRHARIHVDPAQLDEAVDAILSNSLQAATPENIRVVINSTSVASDDTVVVALGDNGAGMSPEVLEHALDPFYSHRPAGRGRGLGLSRAYRLIENNGGRLWMESTPGQGTTVYLALPSRAR